MTSAKLEKLKSIESANNHDCGLDSKEEADALETQVEAGSARPFLMEGASQLDVLAGSIQGLNYALKRPDLTPAARAYLLARRGRLSVKTQSLLHDLYLKNAKDCTDG